jgi:hypothetical protein
MTTQPSYHAQSVAAQALAPLTTLSNALDTLQQTLQASTTYSALPSTTTTIIAADEALTSALTLLQQQQSNHARILALQSQVLALESQIKDIIRRARSIRKDITDIHPSIDADDASDDEEADQPDVDYQQLLNFAARIGKHNAVAKLEAEQQGERLKLEAVRARKKSEQAHAAAAAAAVGEAGEANGVADTAQGQRQQQPPSQQPQEIADKIDREAAELLLRSEQYHTMSRLPFPAPETLRRGELGNLQVARESDPGDPEGAVDREAERLVRETEEIAPDEGMAKRAKDKEDKEREDERRRQDAAKRRAERVAAEAAAAAAAAGPSQLRPEEKRDERREEPPRKKLNLDFPGDYGDDSDDDDD